MFIVGGDEMTSLGDQISQVQSCSLRRVGTLPSSFDYGACNTFLTPSGGEEALLCFHLYEMDGCQTYVKRS